VQLSVELDRIEAVESVYADADARELVEYGLVVDSSVGDVAERIGVEVEQLEAGR
jgi:hypothetical protein